LDALEERGLTTGSILAILDTAKTKKIMEAMGAMMERLND